MACAKYPGIVSSFSSFQNPVSWGANFVSGMESLKLLAVSKMSPLVRMDGFVSLFAVTGGELKFAFVTDNIKP